MAFNSFIFVFKTLHWNIIYLDDWVFLSPSYILCLTSVQFSSVAQSSPTLCNPTNRSTPGLPVHHQLPELTQTHVRRVGDAIQPSHPYLILIPTFPWTRGFPVFFTLWFTSTMCGIQTNKQLPPQGVGAGMGGLDRGSVNFFFFFIYLFLFIF